MSQKQEQKKEEKEKKVYIKTMGCKVNAFDSQVLESKFQENGYTLCHNQKEADLTVLNTCSVTEKATKEAKYLLRRFKRENPNSLHAVTGCYAQIDSAKLGKMKEVDFVIPNQFKDSLIETIESKAVDEVTKMPHGATPVEDNKQSHFKSSLVLFDKPSQTQTRTYIKVQDGCNGFCSYCQIPYARGASRSVPMNVVFDKVLDMVQTGLLKELVLTGIHLGDYGEDFPEFQGKPRGTAFVTLLEGLLSCDEIKRIRLSSFEPSEITDELLAFMVKEKHRFCDHFHLPLQSGSDAILKLMRRQYTKAEYLETVQKLRERFPFMHLSCDVIVGFPGETEEHFQETMDFIQTCQFASLHVFPYSRRPHTAALRYPGHVDQAVIYERSLILRQLSQRLSREYHQTFLHQTMPVLWEEDFDSKGRRLGKTKNYMKVAASLSSIPLIQGMETMVELKGFCDEDVLLGLSQ